MMVAFEINVSWWIIVTFFAHLKIPEGYSDIWV